MTITSSQTLGPVLAQGLVENVFFVGAGIVVLVLFGLLALLVKFYKKAIHGKALVRSGRGGTQVNFESGIWVIPVLHRIEEMDIGIKTITISRTGVDGLICKDNLRADIKVTFFVHVMRTVEAVTQVAFTIGCERASHPETLEALFDAKFSEALKTVGKRFDFVQLYTDRNEFKQDILAVIGRDLNGYHLDDCAIDYLEQTPLELLKENNILDSEGIKKITELTATQQILANKIQREKEQTITKQNVEAQETILELNKQLAEKEAKQKREIANIQDRETAETQRVSEQQRLISEQARIATEEAIHVAEQNKERQIIVAQRNKERTDTVEVEKIKRERDLQINERERIVSLAQIEKEKAIEVERKNIQEVIRERVVVEKAVVLEEEKIKDTRAFAEADRTKKVQVTNAEAEAEQGLVKQRKAAEAENEAQSFKAKTMLVQTQTEAEQKLIMAEASLNASAKEAEAKKIMAEAKAVEEAAVGMSEAQVIEAKAMANRKHGESEAFVKEQIATADSKAVQLMAAAQAEGAQKKGMAEAEVSKQKGITEAEVIHAKADAEKHRGLAEAEALKQRYLAEAEGTKEKAEAMKLLDAVGKDHEEFKLRLNKEKEVELAQISIQKDIAAAQAQVISQALQFAKIDIIGGETMFFDQILGSITRAKSLDRFVQTSQVAQDVKNQFFTTDGKAFKENFKQFIDQFGVSTEDIKNLTVANLLMNLSQKTKDKGQQGLLENLLDLAMKNNLGDIPAGSLL